jgi:hypothetical protein
MPISQSAANRWSRLKPSRQSDIRGIVNVGIEKLELGH